MRNIFAIIVGFFLIFSIVGIASAVTVNITETFGTGETPGCYGISCLPGWTNVVAGHDTDLGYSDYDSMTGQNDGNRYMFLDDGAVVAARVNTTGFNSIKLDLAIRSKDFESDDRMYVGWMVSAVQPTSWNNFNQLDSLPFNETWTNKHYVLGSEAANTQDLWISFYIQGGEADQLFADNVLVSGTASAVPLPPSVWLLGAGLVGLIGLRRKFRK